MRILSQYTLSHRECLDLRLTDSYSIHRAVYDLFPGKEFGHGRILYADKGFRFGKRRILILSPEEPAQSRLGTLDSKKIPGWFLDHSAYRFEVVVNPVRRSSKTRKIEPVKGRRGIAEWFENHSNAWGFEAIQPQVGNVWADQFMKARDMPVTISRAIITGALKVVDREKFRNSFYNGFGRERAFGCGLLQLAPIV